MKNYIFNSIFKFTLISINNRINLFCININDFQLFIKNLNDKNHFFFIYKEFYRIYAKNNL